MGGILDFEGECTIAAPRWLAWRVLRDRNLFERALSTTYLGNEERRDVCLRNGNGGTARAEFRTLENERRFRLLCDLDQRSAAVATALEATVTLSERKGRTRFEYRGAVVLAQSIDEQCDVAHHIKEKGVDAFFASVAQLAVGECESALVSMVSTGEIEDLVPLSTLVSQKDRRGRWMDLGFLAMATVALLVVFLQVSGALG